MSGADNLKWPVVLLARRGWWEGVTHVHWQLVAFGEPCTRRSHSSWAVDTHLGVMTFRNRQSSSNLPIVTGSLAVSHERSVALDGSHALVSCNRTIVQLWATRPAGVGDQFSRPSVARYRRLPAFVSNDWLGVPHTKELTNLVTGPVGRSLD